MYAVSTLARNFSGKFFDMPTHMSLAFVRNNISAQTEFRLIFGIIFDRAGSRFHLNLPLSRSSFRVSLNSFQELITHSSPL